MTAVPIPDRRVRSLRLRAPDTRSVQHCSILLADALHVATIPVAHHGRIVVIRKLCLGKIDPLASSATLALRIEQVARSLIMQAVSAYSPEAPAANAVYFRDFTEALIFVVRRISAHQSMHEWFWNPVFPCIKKGYFISNRWMEVLNLAHGYTLPLLTVASILRETIRVGSAKEMLSSVSMENISTWIRQLGIVKSIQTNRSVTPGTETLSLHIEIHPVFVDFLVEWGVEDLRSFWLAAIALYIVNPSCAVGVDFELKINTVLDQCKKMTSVRRNDTVKGTELNDNCDGDKKSLQRTAPLLSDQMISDPEREISVKVNTGDHTISRSDSEDNALSHQKYQGFQAEKHKNEGMWTDFGGLLFLLPVLERLKLQEFLNENLYLVEIGFPTCFLWYIGRRLGMVDNDPLATGLSEEVLIQTQAVSDGGISEKRYQLVSTIGNENSLDSIVRFWLINVRHWCRKNIRMGLNSLICRRARVIASRTHLDICFKIDQVDMRLRRLALDVDPGWVPWLGKVIRFHYDEND